MQHFIPEYIPPSKESINKLLDVLKSIKHLVVLTGAGISTESGIPDYRSPKTGIYARSKYRPVEHSDFMNSLLARKYYWARNYLTWPQFSASKPNETHKILANWEKSERFKWLITQNIDGLHGQAGSKMISELHGSARRVICMNCKELFDREIVQQWFDDINQNLNLNEIDEFISNYNLSNVSNKNNSLMNFNIPKCPKCGPKSILKPDVVFFGAKIEQKIYSYCTEMIESCDGLLILGSSLTVQPANRFLEQAYLKSLPILIVNISQTEFDHLATVRISSKCSDIIKLVPEL